MSLIPISTLGAEFDAKQRDEWQKMLLGDPLKDTPGANDWAKKNGYQLQSDGSYRKTVNIGGLQQLSTMSAGELANKFKSQQYAEQAAAMPTGSPDYLAQIKQYFGQQPTGASYTPVSNPYEQRLQELMNNPDAIANTNGYRFRFNEGQQALERSAAAKGMLRSGNTLAALTNYGQGAASQEYGNEVSRLGALAGQQNQYNLGRMGLANQEQANRTADWQSRAGTALSALVSGNRDMLAAKELAASNATRAGILSPGTQKASTW